MSKITDEQLKQLQELQSKLNTTVSNIGTLEANKHALLHELAGINKEIEDVKNTLEEQYGSVNINLETGEYTEIEKNEANKED
jgi:vacuolar-type H+-ATPase subunit D/Vma8